MILKMIKQSGYNVKKIDNTGEEKRALMKLYHEFYKVKR
jgi:alpha-L-arabinofuranosidase